MKSYYQFREDLGKRESSGNYSCVNSFGFLGKYQFGKPRLYDLGWSIDGWHPKGKPIRKYLKKSEFLSNRILQDQLFYDHVKRYKYYAEKHFSIHLGKTIQGIWITLSGMIAGAHLQGWGNSKDPGVRQFLEKEVDDLDGYGTKLSEYVRDFAGYDLSMVGEEQPKEIV